MALLVTLCPLLTACQSTKSPQARVERARVVTQNEAGAVVRFDVSVTNPNDFPLVLPKATYRFELDGVGEFNMPDTVPTVTLSPHDEREISFEASFPTREPVVGRDCLVVGALTYIDPSIIRQAIEETGWPPPSVLFSGRGTVR